MSDGARTGHTQRRAGVRDVARLAGVSTQTVSRVINEHAGIRPETRERVRVAMMQLDYRVNNAARALGTRSTRTIGIISGDPSLYGPGAGIVALAAAARESGRWIATAYADTADTDSVREAADHLLAQGVDGLIVTAAHAGTMAMLRSAGYDVPVRAMHDGSGRESQVLGAGLAVDHLVALGHRRIGLISGPGEWLEAIARREGVEAALERHGLTANALWQGDWSATAGAALADEIADAIAAPDGPTALVAPNDQTALGLISGLRARGVQVPRDVSVTGFDDIPDAPFLVPALSTVRIDIAGEARRCLAEVTGAGAACDLEPPQLVARASSARA
ncbi:LacI family DNA-binding transcriptional regulator [Leucobacter sp. wl10]|uniref:LacI family DNA-binding transcriptional regulator n=1 Tax=Leucobacter sp. wl10 TaxID=2304677 RepID=UPI000E5BB7D6|nr:LacI family DNA-binding transcriptional regulator [Leucobacter sp. wl10]RGE16039.1 LacI family transcriptional regulator [Leucobacter sp. wl10]